jgi:hypothetical protein
MVTNGFKQLQSVVQSIHGWIFSQVLIETGNGGNKNNSATVIKVRSSNRICLATAPIGIDRADARQERKETGLVRPPHICQKF